MNFAIIWGLAATALAFTPQPQQIRRSTLVCHAKQDLSRRVFVNSVATASVFSAIQVFPAQAVGPIRIGMSPISYSARLCPPDKPMPGQKAMQGLRPLCVTVKANLEEKCAKDLTKVGVYGFIKDGITGDSVLANNPDLSTDAGQFTIIEKVNAGDTTAEFEFIAAIPQERDLSQYDNGIGPLEFESLRIISYPGGQQYGAISPCEMNEFSDECEAWEKENGPYKRGDYMMKRNARTRND